jgi:hypothetical protein
MAGAAGSPDLSALKIRKCTLSFVYTFFINGVKDLDAICKRLGGAEVVTPVDLLARDSQRRKHSLPVLNLATRLIYAFESLGEQFPRRAIPEPPLLGVVSGARTVKLWETGGGTVRYDINFDSKAVNEGMGPVQILRWAKAGQEADNTLYKDFLAYAGRIEGIAREASRDAKGKAGPTSGKPYWLDNPNLVATEPFPDHGPLTAQGRCPNGAYLPYQEPYVLVFLVLEADSFTSLFLSGRPPSPDVKQFLSILLVDAVEYSHVNEGFAREEYISSPTFPDFLHNFSASTWFYINHRYKVSVAAVAEKPIGGKGFHEALEAGDAYPECYRDVVVDYVEAVRMRWYTCTILNAYLDRCVQEIGEDFSAIQNLDAEHKWEEILQKMTDIVTRAVSTKVLALRLLEDPVLHTLESDGMSSLYRELMRRYAFYDRNRLLVGKLAQISSLYDGILEYARLRRLGALERRPL